MRVFKNKWFNRWARSEFVSDDIFLYTFGKNDKGNISAEEEAFLSGAAEIFISATDRQVSKLLAENTIWEV